MASIMKFIRLGIFKAQFFFSERFFSAKIFFFYICFHFINTFSWWWIFSYFSSHHILIVFKYCTRQVRYIFLIFKNTIIVFDLDTRLHSAKMVGFSVLPNHSFSCNRSLVTKIFFHWNFCIDFSTIQNLSVSFSDRTYFTMIYGWFVIVFVINSSNEFLYRSPSLLFIFFYCKKLKLERQLMR